MEILWATLVIPIVCVLFSIIFFRKEVAWWEVLVQFGSCFIAIGLTIVISNTISTAIKSYDIEYWSNLGVKAQYYEEWNEEVHYTESCNCTTDSNGNTSCDTCWRTRIDDHPEKWILFSDDEKSYSISKTKYEDLIARWKNNILHDLHRNYHTIDGDMYETTWNHDWVTSEPITSKHSYKNKVQATSSVFNYPKVTDEDIKKYGLYNYPEVSYYDCNTVIGGNGLPNIEQIQKYFGFLNGYYGASKQIHLWVFIYRNKNRDTAKFQEALFKGGNKNEFIICIGINKNNEIQWAEVISWTEKFNLKINTKQFVEEMQVLDLMLVAKYVEKNVIPYFVRKPFKDFSYLTVTPSIITIIISFIVVLIINVLVIVWIIFNKAKQEQKTYPSKKAKNKVDTFILSKKVDPDRLLKRAERRRKGL